MASACSRLLFTVISFLLVCGSGGGPQTCENMNKIVPPVSTKENGENETNISTKLNERNENKVPFLPFFEHLQEKFAIHSFIGWFGKFRRAMVLISIMYLDLTAAKTNAAVASSIPLAFILARSSSL